MQEGGSFRLIVRRGPQPNQIYELNKETITLGRDVTNDIVINDPEVSRHHCRLTRQETAYQMDDLGSTNGTFVNGQRLSAPRTLSNGDMIGLGETVTLAYESSAASQPDSYAQPQEQQPPAYSEPAEQAQPRGYEQEHQQDYAQPQQQQDYQQPQQPYQQQPDYAQPQQYYDARPGSEPAPYESASYPPAGYEYEEYEEEGGGTERLILLGCGCLIILCIVLVIAAVLYIDANCLWCEIPGMEQLFRLLSLECRPCP